MMKAILFLIVIIITQISCNKCTKEYYPYINHFVLKNEQVDSVARIAQYLYLNNSNFTNPFDSVRVSLRQEGNNLAIGYDPFGDTLSSFKYKIEFINAPNQEFKIQILQNGCINCNECNQNKYPRIMVINGDTIINQSNIIYLN